MLLGGSTLGGGTGDASGVASGVSTLRGGVGAFYYCGTSVVGGGACGGAAMLKISAICFKATLYLSPRIMSGLVLGFRSPFYLTLPNCWGNTKGKQPSGISPGICLLLAPRVMAFTLNFLEG